MGLRCKAFVIMLAFQKTKHIRMFTSLVTNPLLKMATSVWKMVWETASSLILEAMTDLIYDPIILSMYNYKSM